MTRTRYSGTKPTCRIAAADGSALWHSTGVRLVTNFDAGPPPAPTPTPTPRPPFPPGWTGTASFTGGFVSIYDRQAGSPYPSTVTVAGMGGTMTKVTVTLVGLSHTYPDDLDILLIGPGGQTSMVMSDAGGGYDIYGVSLTFDSGAATTLTTSSQIAGGVYKPVNYGLRDRMPLPAAARTAPGQSRCVQWPGPERYLEPLRRGRREPRRGFLDRLGAHDHHGVSAGVKWRRST